MELGIGDCTENFIATKISSKILRAAMDISLFFLLTVELTKIFTALAILYFCLPVLVILIAQKNYNIAKTQIFVTIPSTKHKTLI